ncbi:Quad-[4Fe-4S] ferredoxin, HycB/HydN/HyfA family [hydrothermal vent metagenome]|uniref:Quad-[4Fe-4S] ferredoxin, HycB/HydN/HyfA family n=1 Tax=hydrothermal vent metagenome TaxID=652676 RepID=A0A3B1CHB8_9ZZZZ
MSGIKTTSRREALKAVGAMAIGAATAGVVSATRAVAARKKAARWAMVIDLRRCKGCHTCAVACKAEFDVPLGSWNTVVKEVEQGAYPDIKKDFLPRLCNHCEGNNMDKVPPCVKVCPEYPKERKVFITAEGKKIRYRNGATYKRPDGMILVDNSLCIGCGKCIEACPYGARSYNKRLISGKDPKKNGISKCSFCMHRVDKGVAPSCVSGCPDNARIFGDLNDPASDVSKLVKEFKLVENSFDTTILPEQGTRPHVFYIDPNKALGEYVITKENKMEEFRDKVT